MIQEPLKDLVELSDKVLCLTFSRLQLNLKFRLQNHEKKQKDQNIGLKSQK